MSGYDEDQVRTLLEEAVADVEPRHGLDAIRARTTSARPRRHWTWAVVGAVAATAATVAGVALVGSADRRVEGPAAGPAGASTSSSAGAIAPLVSVYYLGTTSRGPRLFREPTREDGGLVEAVQDALDGSAADPDYSSPWPAGSTLQQAQLSRGVLSIDLAGPVTVRPAGMSRSEAELAVQQLVYTAQAAVQARTPVTFLVDGRPSPQVLGVDTSAPVANAPADSVLAQVQVDEPADGATVGSSFTVRGRASAFEANVQWELVQDGQVVQRGATTAAECCTLSPYSFSVSGLAPGDYTLVVHDEDPSGNGDPHPWQDTKRLTVR